MADFLLWPDPAMAHLPKSELSVKLTTMQQVREAAKLPNEERGQIRHEHVSDILSTKIRTSK
jgi:hypothetical protein